jgi:hypothetical protein
VGGADDRHAGVVDDYVQAAELADQALERGADIGSTRHVHLARERTPAVIGDQLRGLLGGLAGEVGRHHRGPLRREAECGLAPDSRTGPSD